MIVDEQAPDTGIAESLAAADLLQLLAALLAPPDSRVPIPRAEEPGLGELARLAGVPVRRIRNVLRAAERDDPRSRVSEHARLFEGGQACPPNETAWIRRDKGTVIADVCGFYRAFGFEPGSDTGEKADHVVAELEFAALLLVMGARARAQDDRAGADVTRRALEAFFRDHLGEWGLLFADRLRETAVLPLHERTARLLSRALRTLAERHRLPIAEGDGGLPVPDTGTPYECGLAEAGGREG